MVAADVTRRTVARLVRKSASPAMRDRRPPFISFLLWRGDRLELAFGFRIIGLEPQRFSVMGSCFLPPAQPRQGNSQVEMRFGIIRFQVERLLVMSDCLS